MVSYILIEVADEEQVKQFLMDQQYYLNEPGTHRFLTDVQEHEIEYKLIGVYRKPTMFCSCVQEKKREVNKQMTVGKKYGWHVCVLCGKPPHFMYQTPRNLLLDGKHQTEGEVIHFTRGWWHPENASYKEIQQSHNERPFDKPYLGIDPFHRGG
jgi:hypothetical protein